MQNNSIIIMKMQKYRTGTPGLTETQIKFTLSLMGTSNN